jgi:hypothetical protein
VNASQGVGGAIFIWRNSISRANIQAFDSLFTFFKTVAEAYKTGLFTLRRVRNAISKRAVYKIASGEIVDVKDPAAWRAMKKRLNPVSAKAGAYGIKSASIKVPEIIPVHMEEFQRYGICKTEISANERHKEIEELDYLIGTITRQVKTVKTVSSADYRVMRDGLANLKKLRKALKSYRSS